MQLPTLLEILIAGSVDRKLVAQAMRACGSIEGEKILLWLLEQNPVPRIRTCAAYALGQAHLMAPEGDVSYRHNSGLGPLFVVVMSDFAVSFSAPLQILYFSTDSSRPPTRPSTATKNAQSAPTGVDENDHLLCGRF